MEGQKVSIFTKKIFISVQKMNKSLMGWNFHFWVQFLILFFFIIIIIYLFTWPC